MSERTRNSRRRELLAAVFARARESKRSVWGYDSDNGHGDRFNAIAKVPGKVDRVCVEGDQQWTILPREG